MIMKGVLMPVVSAGSNHAGASEACTPHVIRPSGAAAAASGALRSTDASANIKSQGGRAVIEAPFANVSLPCVVDEPGRRDPGQGARLVLVRHVSGDPDGADHAAGVADQHAARRRDDPSLRHGVERREKGLLLGLLGHAARLRAGADAHPERAPGLSRGDLRANDASAVFPRERFQVPAAVEDGNGHVALLSTARLARRGPAPRRPTARATATRDETCIVCEIARELLVDEVDLGHFDLGYTYIDPRGPRRGGDIDNPGHPRIIGIASGSVRRRSASLPELFAT